MNNLAAKGIKTALLIRADEGHGCSLSRAQQQLLVRALEALFPNDDSQMRSLKRRSLLLYVFGVESSKYLTMGQASALISWALVGGDDLNRYEPSAQARTDAALLVCAHDETRGQGRLPF